ncbi:MAG: formate dehydrogenase subunit gamma [Thermoleophilia bacterium]
MTEYLVRQSRAARAIHWVHTVATLTLFYTGIAIYAPGTNFLVGGPGGIGISMIVHRVAAVLFIAAPLLGMLLRPKGLVGLVKALTQPLDAADRQWIKRFPLYLFRAQKVHLPAFKGEIKPGQRGASLGMIIFSVLIVITGLALWFDSAFGVGVLRWAALLHDISMIMLGVLLLGHIYLGAGIFQPMRGMIRTMFGNGRISLRDAQYNWPGWAEEAARHQGVGKITDAGNER